MRRLLLNFVIIIFVLSPAIGVAVGISIARGKSVVSSSKYVDIDKVYLAVAEVELLDKDPPYNKEVELYWVESSDRLQAKKDLSRSLASQWGRRIRNHSIVDVLARSDWAKHGLRYITQEERPVARPRIADR